MQVAKSAYTVVVVVRDRDPYLFHALSSILNQSLPADRVLVVVNGASDPCCESMSVAKSFGPPVESLLLKELGLVPALNAGIAHVSTPYVAFLDSDDLWMKDKQEKQIDILEENPDFDAVNGVVTNFKDGLEGEKVFLNSAQSSIRQAVTYRSSVFHRFGAFDPSSNECTYIYRWHAQALMRGLKILDHNEVTVLRRIHSENGWVRQRNQHLQGLHGELRAMALEKRNLRQTSK